MKKLISVIAPMYNEGSLAAKFVRETVNALCDLEYKFDFEIILINDGSTDNTFEVMSVEHKNDPKHVAVINLTRNFGLEGAVSAGISVANGDMIIVMDADLQDPPSLIPKMVKEWENGVDFVVAVRTDRANDTFFKRVGAGLFYKILDNLSGKIKIKENAANFRLMSRKALDILKSLPEANKVFRIIAPYVGMKIVYIEYARDKRYSGKSKYSLKSMIPYALDSITGISIKPLRYIIYIPIVLLFLSTVSFLCGIFSYSVIGRSVFWILALTFFLFFIAIGCLAVIAEYIAQIVIEVKHRPASIIYEYEKSGNEKRRRNGY